MTQPNALMSYVGRPDAAFQWEIRAENRSAQGTTYDLHVRSQVWQSIPWEHRLQVCVPADLATPETALLSISTYSGSAADFTPLLDYAQATGIVCACLYDIPNQPLFGDLVEDALIAHTFVQFLDTGDADWPLLLPMVKSVVRAMDVMQAVAAQRGTGTPQRFVVTGASKRGWTTWLTAAVDTRVAAIFPKVYDNLNLPAQMPHQVEVCGTYSEQISDYTEHDLPAKMNSERGFYLAQMVDPYTYRDRLTQPKLIINGANDRYWATDALNLYWDALPPPKWILYVPNSGHGLEDFQRVRDTSMAFLRAIATHRSLPSLGWTFTQTEEAIYLAVTSDTPAQEGRLWMARAAGLDFRDAPWESVPMLCEPDATRLVGEAEVPREGGLAVFGEVTFAQGSRPFTLSTQMHLSRA